MHHPNPFWLLALLLPVAALARTVPPADAVRREVDTIIGPLEQVYRDLHASPELSFDEEKTATTLAERMRALGYAVTTGIGKTGVVAVLANGKGPTVLVRTDMDALPIVEKTGLPYASTVTAPGSGGATVGVMHACGHDVHMSVWLGTATVLVRLADFWRGTLVMIAQPAEEVGKGARAMLDDGLFERFPRPDYALAFHDTPDLAAGTVGVRPGPIFASSDSLDVRFVGRGGHGALPHTTVDPIVMSARFVLALQTLVSRENDPLDPVVVTVGAIHGGTRHNIIPDDVHLQLTVRTTRQAVRDRLLAGIERVARSEAAAAAAPQPPEIAISTGLPPVVNDPALAARVGAALRREMGDAAVVEARPMMVSEDFALVGQAGVPALLMLLGAAVPAELDTAQREGRSLPALHSPLFAPDVEPTLRTGVTAMSLAVFELLQ